MGQQHFPSLLRKLKELRQGFLQSCRDDVPGLLSVRTYAHGFMELIKRTLSDGETQGGGWSLIAVGGFGRGELGFASDLDLLFLYRKRLPQVLEELVRELVYGLWDVGFEVGHSTASVSAVKQLAHDDLTVLTNYLETQFIAGEKSLYDAWRHSFLKSFGSHSRKKFLRNLIRYRDARLHQYGESSYLLEPHVKEGVGGLRDIHTIRWAGTVFLEDSSFNPMVRQGWLTKQEELWLEQAYDFLWRVRLQLHQLTGRRQDQLLFPEQELIPGRFGFMDGPQGSAVEAFMRLYYRHTARVRRTTSFFLERLEEAQGRSLQSKLRRRRVLPGPFLLEGQHLHFMEPAWVTKDARLLMQFFWQAAESNAGFHHQTGTVIRENLGFFGDSARRDPQVIKQFLDILLNAEQAFRVLKVMLETGFLETFLPEFAAVRYKVQYDVYHLYTVDEHLLRTVRELHRMESGSGDDLLRLELGDIFVQLKNRRVLYLAGLLHDIGKGQGKNHSVRGAAMVLDITERMGLTPEETDLISFLVDKHLLLAETALKRDLMDEKPILRCAFEIADQERLRLLYLLTIADSRATGPGAWNTWKASLLRELYYKVDRSLLRGDWRKEDIRKRSEEVQQSVLALADGPSEREELARWLDMLSFRYMFSQSPSAMVEHFRMERELANRSVVVRTRQTEGEMWQITVATRDRPGLFAVLTGVLWSRGLNILSADIFTRQSGIAVDILIVEKLPDPLHPKELWDRVEMDIARALKDKSYLDELLADRTRPSLLQPKALPRKEDRVLIDEEASDFYTIVEVYTWDRPGVLHAIARSLFEMDISIQLAKISTPGAQVADVFYVTDLSGNKLMLQEFHDRVRSRLLEELGRQAQL